MRRARDNPFAVHRVLRERYRLSAVEWQELIARLARLGWRGAIVGPHGSGKTTLLEDLAGRLEGQGWRTHWLRFNAGQRRLARLPRWEAGDLVLRAVDALGSPLYIPARRLLGIDGLAASGTEAPKLAVEVLMDGGHSGIADQHATEVTRPPVHTHRTSATY